MISDALQELENLLQSKGHTISVHPLSKEEIQRYENDERRETAASKSATYPELSFPEYPTSSDTRFREAVTEAEDFNEQVDNALLYSVFRDRVDLLITEDKGIHRKADRLGIAGQVLKIAEARDRFMDDDPAYVGPPSIEKVTVGEIDVDGRRF